MYEHTLVLELVSRFVYTGRRLTKQELQSLARAANDALDEAVEDLMLNRFDIEEVEPADGIGVRSATVDPSSFEDCVMDGEFEVVEDEDDEPLPEDAVIDPRKGQRSKQVETDAELIDRPGLVDPWASRSSRRRGQ